MMSPPLLFVGEGFFPYVGSFAYAFPGRFESWRDLLTSTVPFPSLVRCLAGAPIARGPVAPLLFGVSIHRTPSATRASQRPSGRLHSPLPPLIQPHPPPRLNSSSLYRRVRALQAVLERLVVGVAKVGEGITLELADMGGNL